MAITFIQGYPPQYQLLSTDLTSGSYVTNGGVSFIGAIAYTTDEGNYYRVIGLNTLEKVPQQISLNPDLDSTASNLTLTLASNVGQAQIPDSAKILGFYTTGSTVKVGFSLPAASSGSASGSGVLANWNDGIELEASTWNWMNIGRGISRVIYFRSQTAAEVVKIIQM